MVNKIRIHFTRGYPLRTGPDRFDPNYADRLHYIRSDAKNDKVFRSGEKMPAYGRQHRRFSDTQVGHVENIRINPGDGKFPEYIGWDAVVSDETLEGEHIINTHRAGKPIYCSFAYAPGSKQFSADHVAITDIPYYPECEADSVITCSRPPGISPYDETKSAHTIIMSDPAPSDPTPEQQLQARLAEAEARAEAAEKKAEQAARKASMAAHKKNLEVFDSVTEALQLKSDDEAIVALREGVYGNPDLTGAHTLMTTLLTSWQEHQQLRDAQKRPPDVGAMMADASKAQTVDHSKPAAGKDGGHPFANGADMHKSLLDRLNSIQAKRIEHDFDEE